MKQVLSRRLIKRFKTIAIIFAIGFLSNCLVAVVEAATYTWQGETYTKITQENFARGAIIEYTIKEEFCNR
jgi:uncharacterized membrane protein